MREKRAFKVVGLLAEWLAGGLRVAEAQESVVTIHEYPAWTSLRECARRIVSEDDWLKGGGLHCPAPYFDNCYCRKDLGPVATSYIKSCAYTDCKYNDVDYTAVLNLYNDYCADHGFRAQAPNTVEGTTTIGSSDSPTVVITTIVTEVVVEGSTSLSSQCRPESSVALTAVFLAILFWC